MATTGFVRLCDREGCPVPGDCLVIEHYNPTCPFGGCEHDNDHGHLESHSHMLDKVHPEHRVNPHIETRHHRPGDALHGKLVVSTPICDECSTIW